MGGAIEIAFSLRRRDTWHVGDVSDRPVLLRPPDIVEDQGMLGGIDR